MINLIKILQNLKIFKTILACIVFFSVGAISYAQDDQTISKRPGGNGTISGIVIDKSSNSSMEGSAITIYEAKDTIKIKGTETNSKGMFSVEVPYGKYKLEVNEVGYSMAIVNGIIVNAKNPDVILDTIRLKQATTTTEEIDVTDNKNVIEITPEKKYSMLKNPLFQATVQLPIFLKMFRPFQ